MNCSASQTTSSAPKASLATDPQHSAAEDEKIREVATQFEAALVAVAIRPMTKSLGPMSEIMGQELSLKIAAGMSDPLYQQLRAQIG
jgi:hypothetical protein